MPDQTPTNPDRHLQEQHLYDEPTAQARYHKLLDYQKDMCLRWISEAPTPDLREQRIRRLVRRLSLTSFDPYFHMAYVMFAELDDLYGPSRLFHTLPPDEQTLALTEKRVLGAYQYRNFDDGGISFYIVTDPDKILDDVLMVYNRPCLLTDSIIGWLNRNNIETTREVRAWFDPPDTTPAPG